MKKFFLFLFFLEFGFSFFGCMNSKPYEKEKVGSIIEKEKTMVISIHYPITEFSILNKILKEDTNFIYRNFRNQYESMYFLKERAELNIDYTLKEVNHRYLNITLEVFINSPSLAHPETYMKTYVFDKKEKKILTLKDLITEEDLKKLSVLLQIRLIQNYKDCLLLEEMKKNIDSNFEHYSLFTFSDTTLFIYKNPYEVTSGNCGILFLEVPISNFSLKIPLVKDTFIENEVVPFHPTSKVIDPNKPVLALTFDDGPSIYTKELIDFLKKQGANATFFVLGNKVELYKDLIKESIENGNEIGNHSYSHKDLTRLSIEELKKEIGKTQEILKERVGYTPKLLRPTYGEKNKKIVENTDLKVVLWDVDPKDWRSISKDKIANHILKTVKNKDIILLHDTKKRSLEAVKILVPKLIEQGYQFVTVSELEEVRLLNRQ